ncbi:hypothetical protein AWJ20_4386 [Sugiyamaella lignohabitans]|uniref:Uncharacterized protein n=1 Tax=Sugiyamaella lignohabitans TaxID=796027 RepID=A0A167CDZ5_9ASCO|nr:uncharacterized protein AWJ20_4386 [Sugiyamaella lignohabitans]ANB11566.1 hypothetical protein AWJ20_4386 [Sugiyamaella lignohabitans]
MSIDYSKYSEDIYKVKVVDNRFLLVTLDRPKHANSIPTKYHAKLDALWTQFENDPQLRVAIITGKGKFFCAGADLKGEFRGIGDMPLAAGALPQAP